MHYSIFDKLLLYRSLQKGKSHWYCFVLPTHKGFFCNFYCQLLIIRNYWQKAQKRSQCALVGKIVRRENVNIVGFWEIRIAKKPYTIIFTRGERLRNSLPWWLEFYSLQKCNDNCKTGQSFNTVASFMRETFTIKKFKALQHW